MRFMHCSQHAVHCSGIVATFLKSKFYSPKNNLATYLLPVLTLRSYGFYSQYVVVFPIVIEMNSECFPKQHELDDTYKG
jgi:hypothetical protein